MQRLSARCRAAVGGRWESPKKDERGERERERAGWGEQEADKEAKICLEERLQWMCEYNHPTSYICSSLSSRPLA